MYVYVTTYIQAITSKLDKSSLISYCIAERCISSISMYKYVQGKSKLIIQDRERRYRSFTRPQPVIIFTQQPEDCLLYQRSNLQVHLRYTVLKVKRVYSSPKDVQTYKTKFGKLLKNTLPVQHKNFLLSMWYNRETCFSKYDSALPQQKKTHI